jgi:hypothetical protein
MSRASVVRPGRYEGRTRRKYWRIALYEEES